MLKGKPEFKEKAAALRKKKEEAEEINAELELLHSRLFMESNPIPVKKAVNMMGKCGPAIRQPLAELDISMEGALNEALVKGKCLGEEMT